MPRPQEKKRGKPHHDFGNRLSHSSQTVTAWHSALKTASTFVMWRGHLDVPKPDLILDSSMWHLR